MQRIGEEWARTLLAAMTLFTEMRVLVVYVIALVLFSFIAVIGIKVARRHKLEIEVVTPPTSSAAVEASPKQEPVLDTDA